MTLDESIQDNDDRIVRDGLTVLIDKALHKTVGDLKIDFVEGRGITVERVAPPSA